MTTIYSNLGYILAAWFFYQALKQLYIRYSTLAAKFKLYKIRDDLRMTAITNPDHNVKIFRFLDMSISKCIANIDAISFWSVIYNSVKLLSDDSQYEEKRIALVKEIQNDKLFASFHLDYNKAMFEYVRKKSLTSFTCSRLIILLINWLAHVVNKISVSVSLEIKTLKYGKIDDCMEYSGYISEVSTFDNYRMQ